jgi:hypothetical protein
MSKAETLQHTETISKKSSEKDRVMRSLIALLLVLAPGAGGAAAAAGMGSSAEQARDTLHELVGTINAYSETHDGLPSVGELGDLGFIDGEGNLVLNEGYNGDQLPIDNLTSGATLFEDIQSLEDYVKQTYGDNIPSQFQDLFTQVEREASYNQDSKNLALGSVAALAVGAPAAYALVRSKRKNPTDPTSIDV